MLFSKCIELKQLIVKYNLKKTRDEDCLTYEFGSFADGEWSGTIKCNGCVDIRDFQPIFDWASSLFVSPFMYGSRFGFRMYVQ